MTTFTNPHDPDNLVIIAKVQEWVRAKISLPENAIIEVAELNCMDPGCMDKETRIIIHSENIVQYRIHKPLIYVRQRDVEHLLMNL